MFISRIIYIYKRLLSLKLKLIIFLVFISLEQMHKLNSGNSNIQIEHCWAPDLTLFIWVEVSQNL